MVFHITLVSFLKIIGRGGGLWDRFTKVFQVMSFGGCGVLPWSGDGAEKYDGGLKNDDGGPKNVGRDARRGYESAHHEVMGVLNEKRWLGQTHVELALQRANEDGKI